MILFIFFYKLFILTLRGVYSILMATLREVKIFFVEKPHFIKIHLLLCMVALYFLVAQGWMFYKNPFVESHLQYVYTNDFLFFIFLFFTSSFSLIIYTYTRKSFFYMLDWFCMIAIGVLWFLNWIFTSRITKMPEATFYNDFYLFAITLFLLLINRLYGIKKMDIK